MTHVPPGSPRDGEMARRIREHDWSATSIGPRASWPHSLGTAIDICLGSRHQLAIYWGPELVLLYNDAEIEALGSMHPWGLGRPAREVLSEIWDVVGPLLQGVLETGEATWSRDQPLTFHRHDELEELYFTWSYSPMPDDGGGIGGVLLVTTETTGQVLQARRLGLLRALTLGMLEVEQVEQACAAACATLDAAIPDVQFAAVYLADAAGSCRLVASVNIGAGIAETGDDGSRADDVWRLADLLSGGGSRELDRMPDGAGIVWRSERGARRAFAVPISHVGREGPDGVIVVGLDPLRPFDSSYRDFVELLAGQLGAAIGDADSRASERRRSEALEDLDRAKSAFFGDVSHELRTPLTLILASLGELLEAVPEESGREHVEVATRNARRLTRLVDSLIDFAQIDAGGITASYAPTDLARTTCDIASSFRSVVEQAGLTLSVDCEPLEEAVYVDREAWEKVLLNLLSNAFKFTPEGQVSVRLACVDGMAELVVADTGIGIPAHELPRLFERFHRVRGVVARSHDGVGIGLALVHELISQHGGTVSVESAPGLGTAVRVRLPLGRSHLPAHQLAEGLPPPVEGARSERVTASLHWKGQQNGAAVRKDVAAPELPPDTPRILIVDDNADLRAYLERLLGSRWHVTTAADGEAALALIDADPPDLLLADLMMPGLDGLGLVRALRADPRTQALPVIVLTARAGGSTAVEVLGAGVDGFIEKPFTTRDLIARIQASIDVARHHRDDARIRAEIESAHVRLDRLTRLQAVTASLAAASSPHEIATVIASEGAAALGARGGAVAFATPSGNLEVVASRGYATPIPNHGQIGARAPVALAEAFRTGRSIFVGDAFAVADRYPARLVHLTDGFEALVAMPLVIGSRAQGSVAFSFDTPQVFTPEAERFIELIAQQCSFALDRAERTRGHAAQLEGVLGELRAAQARTLAAADAERQRIERDIHDGAQQQIVAVRVKLSLAESALGASDPAQLARARSMLVESGRELEGALHDLRRLAHGVFPRLLADEGLPSALAAAARQSALPATVEADGVGRLPTEIESAAYFCSLEALQNAAKHAGPDASVRVRLAIDESGALEIEIRDDGAGFDVERGGPGNGLTNMRDRIEACGGTLLIESAPACGTTVGARIPGVILAADAAAAVTDLARRRPS